MTTKRHCDHCDTTFAKPRWIEVRTHAPGDVDPKNANGYHAIGHDVTLIAGDYCSVRCLMTVLGAGFPNDRPWYDDGRIELD